MQLPHYHAYRDQLASLYLGHALWDPDPADLYQQVSIGDVGFVKEGFFYRIFNVLREWDDPSNRTFGEPDPYPRLDLGPFVNIRQSRFSKGEYSRFTTSDGPPPDTVAAMPHEY